MPTTYTMRRTWPENPDSRDDYVFRCDGEDAGRCYFHRTPLGDRWHWTVYGQNDHGDELTFEEAQRLFKEAVGAFAT